MKTNLIFIGLVLSSMSVLADNRLLMKDIGGHTYAISEEIVEYTKIPGVWQKLGENTDPTLVHNAVSGNIDICGTTVLATYSSASCVPLDQFNDAQLKK